MDFDLEIISEEGDHPDPLFDSIMNAMSSMKEATADKIYRKIQKEGATNYSKPQVDRALENALKYGIFEVKNNRYRVRDDTLDDEDTVYWKMQKKKEQSPFRIQDDKYDKQYGQQLDPEKDNRRFRNPLFKECLNCGRIKKGDLDEIKKKQVKKTRAKRGPKDKKDKKIRPTNSQSINNSKVKGNNKRKNYPPEVEEDKNKKKRKLLENKEEKAHLMNDFMEERLLRNANRDSQEIGDDGSDFEIELINSSEHSFKDPYDGNKKVEVDQSLKSAFSSECVKLHLDFLKKQRSSISIKSDSESIKASSTNSDEPSNTKADGLFDDYPCNSRNDEEDDKLKDQYLSTSETYEDQFKRAQGEKRKGNQDWLGCSDEPEGAIIQSNNVLTIEPMDSLSFKSPEQASYIS